MSARVGLSERQRKTAIRASVPAQFLRVKLPPAALAPREYRQTFLANIRVAILRAFEAGSVDIARCEELIRAVPFTKQEWKDENGSR